MDVTQLLKKDHKMVKKMFEEFEGLKGRKGQKKVDLVAQITQALTVHAQVEEELVYPAFRENRSMQEQVGEALEEHHVAKVLLSELDELQPDDERYNAKVKVLSEYIAHHVKEEEKEMFPEAQKRLSAKRLAALGEEVETRKSELMAGEDEAGEEQETDEMKDQDMEDIQEMEEDEGKSMRGGKGQRSKQRAA